MHPTVMVSSGLLLLLTDWLTAVTGDLVGALVAPFINQVDPGKGAVLADFTPATFTGSAAIAVAAWGEVNLDVNGDARTAGGLMQWDWDSGAAETIYGFTFTRGSGELLGYARLETPKLMDDTSDSLAVVPVITLGPTGFGVFVRVL